MNPLLKIMLRLQVIAIFTLFAVTPLRAQSVTVSQGFVDDATRAFIELRAEREVNKAIEKELTAKNALIEAQKVLIENQKQQNLFLIEQNAILAKIKCDKISFLFGIIKKTTCR
jgi:hypothetical protein